MNTNKTTLDLLLNANPADIKRPTKRVEIKRLTQQLIPLGEGKKEGDRTEEERFIVTCEAISPEKYLDIQDTAIKVEVRADGEETIDTSLVQHCTVLAGVKDPNFKNKDLISKYKVPNSLELIKVLLLPGEIAHLYNVISELSGFGKDAVEAVKNLSGPTTEQVSSTTISKSTE